MEGQSTSSVGKGTGGKSQMSTALRIDSSHSLVASEAKGASKEQTPPLWKQRLDAVGSFCITHFLPLGLVILVVFGALVPEPGRALSSGPTSEICIALIFVISGLTLKTADVKEALSEWKAFGLGVALILGATPLLSLLAIELPLTPDEFPLGLAIFTCMPTTLSSGVVLTQQAGGNFALALMLTVFTNLVGVVIIPFLVSAYVAAGSNIDISPVPLLRDLSLTILVPLAGGKILRQNEKIRNFVSKHKKWFTLASSFFLILVPWMRVSDSSDDIADLEPGSIFALILAGVSVHVIYLIFNYTVSTAFRVKTSAKKAVVLLSSQKTLPVAITVINFLDEDEVGEAGLIAIPAIISHISQIVIDSFIVGQWKRRTEINDVDDDDIASDGPSSEHEVPSEPTSPSATTVNGNQESATHGYPVVSSVETVIPTDENSVEEPDIEKQ